MSKYNIITGGSRYTNNLFIKQIKEAIKYKKPNASDEICIICSRTRVEEYKKEIAKLGVSFNFRFITEDDFTKRYKEKPWVSMKIAKINFDEVEK